MINNRKNDIKVEREIAKFFDKYVYSDKDIFTEFVRTDEYVEQINGSDVVLSTKNGKLNRVVVDEKVASRYANRKLNTFSLELSFIGKNDDKKCGWFTDFSKKTEYYMFGWLNKVDIPFNYEKNLYETNDITCDNIRELEWALVSRQEILNFLEKKGWTVQKLSAQDDAIRKAGGVKTKSFIDGVSFRYSGDYVEKPVNILLKKEDYIKISLINGVVSV